MAKESGETKARSDAQHEAIPLDERYPGKMRGRPTVWTPSGARDAETGEKVVASGLRPHPMGQANPIRPLIGAELNEAAREKLARPFESAPTDKMNARGPSVQSQREVQDKLFQTQRIERSIPVSQERPDAAPNLLVPESRWDATLGNVRDEVPVQKSHPPIARGEASIWTPRGRVVVDRGAPSPGEDRTEVPIPPPAPPRPGSLTEAEAKPAYSPGWHSHKDVGHYVIPFGEYANTRPRRAPEREPSQGSVATAEGDNADVPVDAQDHD